MDDALYLRLLEDLRCVGSVGKVYLMLQNEPLLDGHLAERLRSARSILGHHVQLSIVTSGSLLNSARIEELVTCGLDHVSVSIDAFHEATYFRVRSGLDFRQVVWNTEQLLRRARRVRVTVRFLRQRINQGEESSFARFWKSRGAHVRFDRLTNRAGMLDGFNSMQGESHSRFSRAFNSLFNRAIPFCPLPFAWLNVLWDGRVILCPHDWAPRDILGDLSKQSVREVWNSEPMNHYRLLARQCRTSESTVCRECSLAGRFWNV